MTIALQQTGSSDEITILLSIRAWPLLGMYSSAHALPRATVSKRAIRS